MDDVTWFVEGSSVREVREQLEWCAQESLQWAESNAVRFEVSKMEAVLLSRKRGLVQASATEPVRVGDFFFSFASEATRWLGVWLDSALTLRTSRRKALNRARAKETALKQLVTRRGLAPAVARNLQQAIVSGTMLYAQQLSWDGSKKVERETQVVLNRMGRASLGVRQTTPVGIVAAESGLTPARALLDHTQARFALRLLARPQGGGGQEEIMEKRSSALTARIRERAGLKRRETCEVQVWDTLREFQGEVFVDSKEEALRTAQEWTDLEQAVWTDGSRLDNGRVGAAWVWMQNGEWKEHGIFLGTNKEVFDAEVYAICEAIKLLDGRGETEQSYVIFSDSQAAIHRVLHEECGPAQALARIAIDASRRLRARGNDVTIRRTPSHQGVPGNERAGMGARVAAAGDRAVASPTYLREASLSHLTGLTTETRSTETSRWIRERVKRKHRYRPPPGGKMRKGLRAVRKECAGRFYQLMSGHAATAPHLKRIGQVESDRCWLCNSGQRQSRFHLFRRCRGWRSEIREMWRRIEAECEGGPRAPSVRGLFQDPRATPAVLDFLRDTRVGKMPGLEIYGIQEDELGREVELWAEDGDTSDEDHEEERGGPDPP